MHAIHCLVSTSLPCHCVIVLISIGLDYSYLTSISIRALVLCCCSCQLWVFTLSMDVCNLSHCAYFTKHIYTADLPDASTKLKCLKSSKFHQLSALWWFIFHWSGFGINEWQDNHCGCRLVLQVTNIDTIVFMPKCSFNRHWMLQNHRVAENESMLAIIFGVVMDHDISNRTVQSWTVQSWTVQSWTYIWLSYGFTD